jgi:hypothetical protein
MHRPKPKKSGDKRIPKCVSCAHNIPLDGDFDTGTCDLTEKYEGGNTFGGCAAYTPRPGWADSWVNVAGVGVAFVMLLSIIVISFCPNCK